MGSGERLENIEDRKRERNISLGRVLEGDGENYILNLVVFEDFLNLLKSYLGEEIQAVEIRESWEKEGEMDDDIHSGPKSEKYEGILCGVRNDSIILRVKSQEGEAPSSTFPQEIRIPFFEEFFKIRTYRGYVLLGSLQIAGEDLCRKLWEKLGVSWPSNNMDEISKKVKGLNDFG